MGFYAELRREAEPLFAAILRHPFISELVAGTLPRERFAYYVCQDYQYLRDFKQALGLAISRLETPREIFDWIDRIAGLADAEASRHLTYARQLGLTEAQLLAADPDPMALVYRQHMLLEAHRGLGPMLAALLPCPTTYHEIGDRFADDAPDHPIYGDWLRSYSPRHNAELARRAPWWTETLDRVAEVAGPAERERMRVNFLRSCRFEWMFWEMAYKMSGWPI